MSVLAEKTQVKWPSIVSEMLLIKRKRKRKRITMLPIFL